MCWTREFRSRTVDQWQRASREIQIARVVGKPERYNRSGVARPSGPRHSASRQLGPAIPAPNGSLFLGGMFSARGREPRLRHDTAGEDRKNCWILPKGLRILPTWMMQTNS